MLSTELSDFISQHVEVASTGSDPGGELIDELTQLVMCGVHAIDVLPEQLYVCS